VEAICAILIPPEGRRAQHSQHFSQAPALLARANEIME
jgi:hypothetical protein